MDLAGMSIYYPACIIKGAAMKIRIDVPNFQ